MKKDVIIILLGPVALILLWLIIGFLGLIDPLYLPSLPQVFNSLVNSFTLDSELPHLWATLYRTLAGFILAGILGIPLGIFLGSSRKFYLSVEFLIDFSRSLPAPALFPLFLLFFGIGDAAKIAVATFVAFWIILINTICGVRNLSKLRVQVGKVFRASPFQILKEIVIPDAMPQIFVGLRIALSFALILVIVSEMFIGTKRGLGLEIFNSYMTYHIPRLYALIIIVGLLGYALNKIFIFFEKKIVHWAGK